MNLLLPELGRLFNNRRGPELPNGHADLGFNCRAKAFVAMYLARLRGLPVDICRGELLVAEKGADRYYSYHIAPHAWVGSPTASVIDLSMRDFQDRKFLPVIGGNALDQTPWHVAVTAEAMKFQEFGRDCPRLADGAHMLYWMNEIRVFRFEELAMGGRAVTSEATREIAARYPGNNVIAKAILHLHTVAKGTRFSLVAETQKKAWDELARWQIDAVDALKTLLHEAGTLHASARWEQDGALRLNPAHQPMWELPAPPCRIAS